MKKAFSFFTFIFLLFTSCNHVITKDQYLKNYDTFLDDIKLHYQQYDEKQWKVKDLEFKEFDDILYNNFKGQLTTTEQTKILRYSFVYNLVRGNISLSDLASGKYNEIISCSLEQVISVFKEAALLKKRYKGYSFSRPLNKINKIESF